MSINFHCYDGLGLAALVRERQVTPPELVDEAIRRIEAHNPGLNAVVRPLFEQARAAARAPLPNGPFLGVPMLLKDFWSVYAGAPTSAGNRLLAAVPRGYDSELVRRWKAAGALIVGKTNTPEFAYVPVAEPVIFGPARNPWDLGRSPGGSSGGSAAAVAARMVPLAGATDGGGSIRVPASCCGLFGLKVTRGRTPTGPGQGEMWRGLGVEHVITRSVRDSAAMLDATAGPEPGAPYAAPHQARPFLDEVTAPPGRLRIAFTDRPIFGRPAVDPECRRGLEATVGLLEELGHELVEDRPRIDGEPCARALLTVVAAEIRADMAEAARLAGRRLRLEDFETATFGMGSLGAATSAADYVAAWRLLQRVARQTARFFSGYDLLLTPTMARPPVPIGHYDLSPLEELGIRALARLHAGWVLGLPGVFDILAARVWDIIPYTALFNITGQPAMSVPLHWSDGGLPMGMHFVGRFGDEATLLRLAGQLERARPWLERAPPGFDR